MLSKEPKTIKLSSIKVMISPDSVPLSRSSPFPLNAAKLRFWLVQFSITCVSLASISFSLMAEMQISFGGREESQGVLDSKLGAS